jgi:hypothetical protein
MSSVLPTGLGILSSDVRFDQFALRSRGDTPAVEHCRDWKQSLTAGALALIVVEEFEGSFPQFDDCDVRRRSDIQRAAIAEGVEHFGGIGGCAGDHLSQRHAEHQ